MSATGPRRGGALLIPNIAAEEGAVWDGAGGEEVVRDVARLWSLLFAPNARVLGNAVSSENGIDDPWPSELGPRPESAVFPELEGGECFAWLHTAQAREIAEDAGMALAPPEPDVAMRLHDKAFAQRVARTLGLEPEALREIGDVIEPELLAHEPERVVARLEESLARWPAWLGRRFTLKPRFGSSGRGRLTAKEALDALLPALPRLAERGGAVFEPWLERVRDLSAQFWIEPGGQVRLLGTLELLVSPAGVYRGHRGSVDNKGRVTSLCPEDERLREAGAALAVAAAEQGFSGPCAVDAFSFRGPAGDTLFRPVVEFNARFTMGTVVIGLVRRALPTLRRALPRDANERRAFQFSLAPPETGWPREAAPERFLLPLSGEPAQPRAALLVAEDLGHLEMAFQDGDSPSILRH